MAKRGPAFQKVFDYCYAYKHYWTKRGRATPICDRVVFNKIRALLGGSMDFILVGGAPLCPETHDFIRTCLGVMVVQVCEEAEKYENIFACELSGEDRRGLKVKRYASCILTCEVRCHRNEL